MPLSLLTVIKVSRTERKRHSLGGRVVSLLVVVIVSVTTDEKRDNYESVHTRDVNSDSYISYKCPHVNPDWQVLSGVLSDTHGDDSQHFQSGIHVT